MSAKTPASGLKKLRKLFKQQTTVCVWLIVVTASSGFLLTQPLLDVLTYEYSFVMAGVFAVAGMHIGVTWAWKWRRAAKTPPAETAPEKNDSETGSATASLWGAYHTVGRLYLSALVPVAALWFLALDFAWAHGVVTHQCNTWLGFGFFVTLSGVTVLISVAVGIFWGLLFSRRIFSTLAAVATLLASVAFGFYKFYTRPPVCVYDPFLGYFSGNLYDALLLLEGPLIWARVMHLGAAVSLLGVAALFLDLRQRRLRWRPRFRIAANESRIRYAWAIGLLASVPALTLTLCALHGRLGFDLDETDLSAQLGGAATTPHFHIHYPPDAMSSTEVRRLALDAEFRHYQLERFFGRAPRGRIGIYVFGSDLQKKRLMGAHQVEMAKPWRKEVYLKARTFPHGVIKHELAHVFAGAFGDPMFGVAFGWSWWKGVVPIPAFSPGLIEGAAVAADWLPATLTPHQKAKAMHALDLAPTLTDVMGYSFFASAAVRSYSIAGSFCRFLIETYGAQKFRELYRAGGGYSLIYRKSLPTLEREWRTFIEKVPLSKADQALARRSLSRRSVFQRVCIHRVASLEQKADALPAAEAAAVYGKLCALDPYDVSHFWSKLYHEAQAAQHDKLWWTAGLMFVHPRITNTWKVYVYRVLGNVEWSRGHRGRAKRWFALALRLPASESTRRDLQARMAALSDPRIEKPLRRLLVDGDLEAVSGLQACSAKYPRWGLGPYLLASILASRGRYATAATLFRQAMGRRLPSVLFRREALKRLGKVLFLQDKLEAARRTFQVLEKQAESQAARLAAADWIERCRWMKTHGRKLRKRFHLSK
jgi:tetratricopeptide (TPR) repeat protein